MVFFIYISKLESSLHIHFIMLRTVTIFLYSPWTLLACCFCYSLAPFNLGVETLFFVKLAEFGAFHCFVFAACAFLGSRDTSLCGMSLSRDIWSRKTHEQHERYQKCFYHDWDYLLFYNLVANIAIINESDGHFMTINVLYWFQYLTA